MKKTIIISISILALIIIFKCLIYFNIVSIYYNKVYENKPLTNPVKVKTFTDNTLYLADGRVFLLETTTELMSAEAARALLNSDYIVEIVEFEQNKKVEIYIKTGIFYCGGCGFYRPIVIIPIIPNDFHFPRYRKELLGIAKEIKN